MRRYEFSDKERVLMEGMQMPFAIYQFVDKHVVTLILSDGFCKLLGYDDRAQAYHDMDNDMYIDTHPDDVARIAEAASRFAVNGGKYEVVYRSKSRKDPGYRIIHAIGEHIYMEDGTRLAQVWYTDEGEYSENDEGNGTFLSQTLNKVLHEENFMKATYYDALTGLPSMSHFYELAEAGKEEIEQSGQRPALLFIDLGGMKYFNRKYGFAEGDQLLKDFAHLLAHYFTSENCSRFGQDHFAVYTAHEGVEEKLQNLFEDFKKEYGEKALNVRVGIYLAREEKIGGGIACDRAKLACDVLKKRPESCFNYYSDALLENAEKQQYVIKNLDRAISEGWIKVYYQPIVRALSGRVCDEEALARWDDPERGLMSPADFIPILEETKLIYKLDLCVVDQVLKKIKKQAEMGLEVVPQSVNLSRSDFDTCDIVEEIRKRVDEAGISRELITIEITESVVGSDFEFMKEQVRRFRELGFPVWMDDFGSGYSSMDVLQSFDFNLIKFDMRFMQQYDRGEKSRIILTELMKMMTSLGVDTVCEGVETKEQKEFLQEIGCSRLQGYYYSKPLPAEMLFSKEMAEKAIGFENPKEAGYYESIGKISLYDLAMLTREDEQEFTNYFNTIPMAIMEVTETKLRYLRCNQSYRTFLNRSFGIRLAETQAGFSSELFLPKSPFLRAALECGQTGNRVFVDEALLNGTTIHAFARRLAVNPVAGTSAVGVAVLSILEAGQGTTFASVARALAKDYFNIFYVDMETEKFVEYSSVAGEEALDRERHGEDFFAQSRADAKKYIYPEDVPRFVEVFTKENVVQMLKEQGTFAISYRLNYNDKPVYVMMKGMWMDAAEKYMVFAVNNVDMQMKQKVMLDEARKEQVALSRIAALSGDYIALYTVDMDTNYYTEYNAAADYSKLGLEKEGADFFEQSAKESKNALCPDDLPLYNKVFNKDNILHEIEHNGKFTFRYRLMIGGKAVPAMLTAALVKESDGDKLIFGISKIEGKASGCPWHEDCEICRKEAGKE